MQPSDRNRVTVQEAARRLGVTEQAIRKRVKRGTLEVERDGGRVYVYLDASNTGYEPGYEPSGAPADPRDELIEVLREQLEAEREANRENRRLLAAALRMGELEPPQREEPPESTEGSRGPWWKFWGS